MEDLPKRAAFAAGRAPDYQAVRNGNVGHRDHRANSQRKPIGSAPDLGIEVVATRGAGLGVEVGAGCADVGMSERAGDE